LVEKLSEAIRKLQYQDPKQENKTKQNGYLGTQTAIFNFYRNYKKQRPMEDKDSLSQSFTRVQ
jgi:hypothetical protein